MKNCLLTIFIVLCWSLTSFSQEAGTTLRKTNSAPMNNDSLSGIIKDSLKSKAQQFKIGGGALNNVSNAANLFISSIVLSVNPVEMNEGMTIDLTVNEVGGRSVSSREIAYYLSTDFTITASDYYLGNDFVTLSANGSGTESLSFVPQDISGLSPGYYYVGIIIPDENEYWYSYSLLTINAVSNGADLEIPSIELSPDPVEMNQSVTIDLTVNEVGGSLVSSREIAYYLSTDSYITTSDYYLGNEFVTLSAYGSGTESLSFVPKDISGLSPGNYYVGIIIPDENEYWYNSIDLLTINAADGGSEPDIEVNPRSVTIDEPSQDRTSNLNLSNSDNDKNVNLTTKLRRPNRSLKHAPNELIVKFSPYETISFYLDSNVGKIQTQNPILNSTFKKLNVVSMRSVYSGKNLPDRLSNTYLIEISGKSIDDAIAELSQLTNVEWVDLNYQYRIDEVPNDSRYNEQYYLPLINAEQAWGIHSINEEITIAIIDTGVDWGHPDLASNIWMNEDEIPDNGIDDDGNGYIDDIRGWDWVDNADNAAFGEDSDAPDNDPMDFHGHGTHCSGIAGAVSNNNLGISGLGRGVKIMSLRAGYLAFDGMGYLEYAAIASAVEYAIENGARVINMSFTGGQELVEDVMNAFNNNVVVCHAAGNSDSPIGSAIDGIDQTLSIAATDAFDKKADFSNYGDWIDVSAPGVSILSTVVDNLQFIELDDYQYFDGTSMSSPLVAGLAGLILSMDPSLTAIEVMEIITSSADNIDSENPGFEGRLGVGRINAVAALSQIESQTKQSIVIRNVGNGILNLSSISSNEDWLTTSIASFPIELGSQSSLMVDLSIDWELVGKTEQSALLSIVSDDADESIIDVSVTVIPRSSEEATLVYNDQTVLDGINGEGLGDEDGMAEPGEEIALEVELYNSGTIDAYNVAAILSTTDPDITITDDAEVWGDIPAGTTEWEGGFNFKVSASSVEKDVTFTLAISSDEGNWTETFTLHVYDSVNGNGEVTLVYNDQSVLDGIDGEGRGDKDGRAEPGEEIALEVELYNRGAMDAHNVAATLSTTDTDITITDDAEFWGDIPAGTTEWEADFNFDVAASSIEKDVTFTLAISSDEGNWTESFILRIHSDVTLVYNDQAILDGIDGEGSGDEDGRAEPGEEIALEVELYNRGTIDAHNVAATLSTTDTDITMTDDAEVWGDIPAGTTEWEADFNFDVSASSVEKDVTFTLAISSDEGNWTESFTLHIYGSNGNSNAVQSFEITAIAETPEGGTVSGTGTYEYGQSATLNAFPETGYNFVSWIEDGTAIATEPSLRFTVTEARNLVANFGLVTNVSNQNNKIFLYPNPVKTHLNINWSNFERAVISELSGKQLFEANTRTIDLQTLNAGVYLVTLSGTDSERITYRIIKE